MIKFDHKAFEKDVQDAVQKLERAGKDTAQIAADIITVVTDKLEEESVKRAPIDEGFLEKSHQKVVNKAEDAMNVEGIVFIPSNSPAAGYAMYMHELDYKLGPRSREKQGALSGIIVGRKYLERALSENAEAFGRYIVMKLREALK